MAFGLVQAVLESHGLERTVVERNPEVGIRLVDQVLLGSEQAPLVVALLRRAGVESARVSPALVDPGCGGDGGEDEPATDWRRAALGLGLLVPRPGHGDLRVLQRERLAAPGRLALCAGRLAACGALGMLALETDALVAAAVLAGGPFAPEETRVLGVELVGALAPAAGGVDLALALLSRLREAGEAVQVLELGGDGVGTLAMTERMSAAWLLGEAGLLAMFPSDEVTRAELAAQGRDQDWRRIDAVRAGDGAVWNMDLGSLESRIAPLEELADSRPASAFEGIPVERVLMGPAATVADLARLAARFEGQRVHGRVECTVVVGSRSVLDRVAGSGVAQRLAAAGVRVTEGQVAAHAAGSGAGLCFGVPHEAVASGRARWLVAGVECCAAAALAGTVTRPGRGGEVVVIESGDGLHADPWMSGGAGPQAPAPAAARAWPGAPAAPCGPFRGEVLAVLGDELECARLLAPGARLEGLRGRLRALAGQLLAGMDPGFAERARERGGGFVVAGTGFARGEPRAAVALCLAESSVRAVLARSYAPGAALALVHSGVMPLLLMQERMPGLLERGDELELPGLPEALVPAHPLTARNLTRGTHLGLGHDLSARAIAVLRAGGLLPFVTGRAPGAGRH
jgi:aconitate hydratase